MTALFLIPAAQGHLNRSFLVARQLQHQGYSIQYGYTGLPDMARAIQRFRNGCRSYWLFLNHIK